MDIEKDTRKKERVFCLFIGTDGSGTIIVLLHTCSAFTYDFEQAKKERTYSTYKYNTRAVLYWMINNI